MGGGREVCWLEVTSWSPWSVRGNARCERLWAAVRGRVGVETDLGLHVLLLAVDHAVHTVLARRPRAGRGLRRARLTPEKKGRI